MEDIVIDIKGIGQFVYSVFLAKGHGYIRFSGYKDFIGGTVEVGNHIFMPIKKDMVIVAREGSYRLTLENGDLKGIYQAIAALKGEKITDAGYMSSSPCYGASFCTFNPIALEIVAPEGTPGAYINQISEFYN